MGCQPQIAEKIIEQVADYVLAVKQNQGHLVDDIQEAFQQTPRAAIAGTLENHMVVLKRGPTKS